MECSQIFADVLSFIMTLVNPERILTAGGLFILTAIIFAETGLFFGFFLPGDSLLFTAGLFTAGDIIEQNVVIVLITVTMAAIAGDFTGYWFGRKTGNSLFKSRSRFLNQKHLHSAKAFYKKHGANAIILGRFLPIIRTFAPILAGSIKMEFKKFSFFNIVGGIIWTHFFILAGYLLAKNFPQIDQYLLYIILLIGVVTAIPFLKSYLNVRRKNLLIQGIENLRNHNDE
jgi:membrane-associated protein